MKDYAVTIPVAGSIIVFVEANSEDEAKDMAFEKQDWRVETGEGTEAGEDWQALTRICSGNVCYAPCWEISVEES